MKIVGKLVIGLVLVLSLLVAVSASTSSHNWSFGSGGGTQVEDVLTPVTKTVEVLNPVGPHRVNMWTSDPVAAPAENGSLGSDQWSKSGPVGGPSTIGIANSDGWRHMRVASS